MPRNLERGPPLLTWEELNATQKSILGTTDGIFQKILGRKREGYTEQKGKNL